jgi:hypothetical protein
MAIGMMYAAQKMRKRTMFSTPIALASRAKHCFRGNQLSAPQFILAGQTLLLDVRAAMG